MLAAFAFLSFVAGYNKRMVDFDREWSESGIKDVEKFYIIDSNGDVHIMDCYGYDLINTDSVMLCNGERIKYSRKKPIKL